MTIQEANDRLQAAYQAARTASDAYEAGTGSFAAVQAADAAVTQALHDYEVATGASMTVQTTGGQMPTYPVYRAMLHVTSQYGQVGTGASYPGCTSTAPNRYQAAGPCDPRYFSDFASAYAYAHNRGEVPYVVSSEQEAWNLFDAEERARMLQAQFTGPSASPMPVNGGVAAAMGGMSLGTISILAAAAYFLLRRK